MIQFWLGGQVALIMILWAEWYAGDKTVPKSIQGLDPSHVAFAMLFLLFFWPGFIVAMAINGRERYLESQKEFPAPKVKLCKGSCYVEMGIGHACALCPFCEETWTDVPCLRDDYHLNTQDLILGLDESAEDAQRNAALHVGLIKFKVGKLEGKVQVRGEADDVSDLQQVRTITARTADDAITVYHVILGLDHETT